jgi:hypothetical protein
MAKLELTNDQLQLIQKALDFYSRVGIMQFDRVLDHPTIDNVIDDRFRPKKELEVGDRTERGEIVEIKKKQIKTKGSWGNGEEIKTWKDIENIKLSTDWSEVHRIKDEVRVKFSEIQHLISGDIFVHKELHQALQNFHYNYPSLYHFFSLLKYSSESISTFGSFVEED